ncbi:hypothetical protein ACK2M7_12740 [Chryseobacterium sp. TY4]
MNKPTKYTTSFNNWKQYARNANLSKAHVSFDGTKEKVTVIYY